MANQDKLDLFREKIDEIDSDVLDLLSKRAKIAQDVGLLKGSAPKYRPEREAKLLARLRADNTGPLQNIALNRIFTEIISACRALEESPVVACLGPKGTFSEQAVLKCFGHSVEVSFVASIDAVFREVQAKNAAYGVVPLENSTEGAVARTLDLFVASELKICGEIILPIHHNFLTTAKDISIIREVYSHSQSFGQCSQWLLENIPHAERVVVSSNAEAAKLASLKPEFAAAVGGLDAGKQYGLPPLVTNIEDDPNNITRFVVIGNDNIGPSNGDKTSFVMSTPSQPGALSDLLQPLKQNNVNMSRLESRPSRSGVWEYVFFVDVLGHQADNNVASALEQIRDRAGFLKILGSYPIAER